MDINGEISYLDLLFYEMAKRHDEIAFANTQPHIFDDIAIFDRVDENFLIFGKSGSYSLRQCPACEISVWDFIECELPTNWDEHQENNFADVFNSEYQHWINEKTT